MHIYISVIPLPVGPEITQWCFQDCYLSGLIVEYDLLTVGDHVAIGSGSGSSRARRSKNILKQIQENHMKIV